MLTISHDNINNYDKAFNFAQIKQQESQRSQVLNQQHNTYELVDRMGVHSEMEVDCHGFVRVVHYDSYI